MFYFVSSLLQLCFSYKRFISAFCVTEAAPNEGPEVALKTMLRFNSWQSCSVSVGKLAGGLVLEYVQPDNTIIKNSVPIFFVMLFFSRLF